MPEYNLSFLEACELYNRDNCEAIEHESGCRYKVNPGFAFGSLSIVNVNGTLGEGIMLSVDVFLGKWRVIRKPVKHKEIFEDIKWQKGSISGIISPEGCNWGKLLNKPRMKVTCEWDE